MADLQWNWIELQKNFWKSTVDKMFNQSGTFTYKVYDQEVDDVVDIELPTIRQIVAELGGGGSAGIDDMSIGTAVTHSSYKLNEMHDYDMLAKSFIPYLTAKTGLNNYYILTHDDFYITSTSSTRVIGDLMAVATRDTVNSLVLDITVGGGNAQYIAIRPILYNADTYVGYRRDMSDSTIIEVTQDQYEQVLSVDLDTIQIILGNASYDNPMWCYGIILLYG